MSELSMGSNMNDLVDSDSLHLNTRPVRKRGKFSVHGDSDDSTKVRLVPVSNSEILRLEVENLRAQLAHLTNQRWTVAKALKANDDLSSRLSIAELGLQVKDVLISDLVRRLHTMKLKNTLHRLGVEKSNDRQRYRDVEDDNLDYDSMYEKLYKDYGHVKHDLAKTQQNLLLATNKAQNEATEVIDSSCASLEQPESDKENTRLLKFKPQVSPFEIETSLMDTNFANTNLANENRDQITGLLEFIVALSSRALFAENVKDWIAKLESLKDFKTNIFAQTKIRANHSVVSELMELEEYRKNNEMLHNSQTVQEAHFNELQ
ncbi:MAG: hypothetical protein NXY57DRAFT_1044698, partial [Lentinula lateritia]